MQIASITRLLERREANCFVEKPRDSFFLILSLFQTVIPASAS